MKGAVPAGLALDAVDVGRTVCFAGTRAPCRIDAERAVPIGHAPE